MARTLAVHPGALGDVLLAIPALRLLRAVGPEHEVVLAAQPHIGALLQALGEVDASVRFDALRLDALFAEDAPTSVSPVLRDVERVVCWYGARDPDFVRRLRDLVPDAVVAPSVPETGTVWEHLVATARQTRLDVPLVDPGVLADGAPSVAVAESERARPPRSCAPVAIAPALVVEGRRALERAGWDGAAPLVVVHPGASGPRKQRPVDDFVDPLDTLPGRFAIVVHEGPTDAEAARALITRRHRPVIHLANPSLPALAGALVHAAAYLGNDSGISQLAAAIGVPSIVLFRHDLLRWVPWATGVETIVVRAGEPAESEAAAAALLRALAAPGCHRE